MTRSGKAWLPLGLVAVVALAIVGLAAVVNQAEAAANSVSITPAIANVSATNQSTDVKVTIEAPTAKLGAWEILVKYDPAKLTVTINPDTGCADVGSNVCNATFASDTVKIAGASASGVSGAKDLATITVKALGAVGACGDLTVTAPVFTDPLSAPTSPTVSSGKVCVQAPTPTPSPSPVPATPTASPSPSPKALPPTGGAPADDGSSMTAWLLAALGLVVVSGGAWAVARTRR